MADNNERTPLLKVEHLSKEFPAESGMFAKRFFQARRLCCKRHLF